MVNAMFSRHEGYVDMPICLAPLYPNFERFFLEHLKPKAQKFSPFVGMFGAKRNPIHHSMNVATATLSSCTSASDAKVIYTSHIGTGPAFENSTPQDNIGLHASTSLLSRLREELPWRFSPPHYGRHAPVGKPRLSLLTSRM